MGLGPPVTGRRRRPVVWIGSGIGVLVVVVVGVIVAVNASSSHPSSTSSSHSVTTLKAVLDKVPLPSGARLVDEQADPEHGDANAFVQRRYRLAATPASSQQIRAALERGDCRLVDAQSGQTTSAADSDWSSLVRPTTGDLYVLPRGTKGGGIELSWKDDLVYVSVKGGDAELG